jgi:hypothetical protein
LYPMMTQSRRAVFIILRVHLLRAVGRGAEPGMRRARADCKSMYGILR